MILRNITRLMALVLASAFTIAGAQAQHWSRSWAAAPQGLFEGKDAEAAPPDNLSYRQIILLSDGGTRLRVRLTNELSENSLHIGSASIALVGTKDGCVIPESMMPLTFSGRRETHIPAHAPMLSDPVAFRIPPAARLAVTLYFPEGTKGATQHQRGWTTGFFAPGNQATSTCMPAGPTDQRRIALAGVEVENANPHRTIVTIGDSITDGSVTTVDANRRWPDQLAERLRGNGMKTLAVANQGISGNRVLRDGNGPNALARFDRDVLSVPSASHVIILEGLNDIGNASRANEPLTAEDMIEGYRQLISRARSRGIKVLLGTITPYKGARYWSERGEAIRRAVNQWMISSHEADGVIDFAAATSDRADPDRLAPAYDSGDALHPNDAGMKAMADAVDVKLLR